MTAICSVRRFWPTSGTRSGVPRMRLIERMERCSSKFSLASWPKARVPSRRRVTTEGVHSALVVGQDLGLAVVKVGDDRVAGAEVDADVRHEQWLVTSGQ